uniref:Uncharacterized protein n=1 Tax=Helianthus annuus TaxID=4232 RepID=A0A251T9S4_HELAN
MSRTYKSFILGADKRIHSFGILKPGFSTTLHMNSNELVGDGDPSHCGLGSSIFINDNHFLSLMVGEL